MHRTMFDTPIIKTLVRWFSILYLRLAGWRSVGGIPTDMTKGVMIAAPHTSNWDLPFMLFVAFELKISIYWMGKQEIFKPPFKSIMKWMGGIPVDRSKSSNMVNASIEVLDEHQSLIIIVPPEGTRSKTRTWKTGFYHIANGAKLPIFLGFLDYKNKVGGIGPCIIPSGDMEKDMEKIKAFYADKTGKNADRYVPN